MPLDKQTLNIPMVGGVETNSDPLQLGPGKLLLAENVRYESPKRVTKRPGFAALARTLLGTVSTDAFTAGYSLGSFNDQLVVGDGHGLYGRVAEKWNYRGPCEAVRLTSQAVIRNDATQSGADAAYSATTAVFAWVESGSVYCAAVDRASGRRLDTTAHLAAPNAVSAAKVLLLGSTFYVLWAENDGAYRLKAALFDPSDGTTVTNILINGMDSGVFDAAVIEGTVFILYGSGSSQTALCSWDGATVSAPTVVAARTLSAGTVIAAGTGYVGVLYADNTELPAVYVRSQRFTTGLVLDAAEQDLALYGVGMTVPSVTAVWGATVSGNPCGYFAAAMASASPLQAHTLFAGAFLWSGTFGYTGTDGWVPAGRPVLVGDVAYFPALYRSTGQPTYGLCRLSLSTPTTPVLALAAKYAPSAAPDAEPSLPLPTTTFTTATVAEFPFLRASLRDAINQGVIGGQCGVMAGRVAFNEPQQSVEFADGLYTTGGILHVYDGTTKSEAGFTIAPDAARISVTPVAAGGSLEAGPRYYVVVYEYTDAQGNLHRSAPSAPIPVTTALNDKVMVSFVAPPSISHRPQTSVAIYRTEANGALYYRLTGLPNALTYLKGDYGLYSWEDTVADASIIGNETLYTDSGEAANIAPPAPRCLAVYKNRLVVVSSEDPTEWRISKQRVQGFPAEFSDDLFTQRMDERIFAITAVQQMDDKLIFFGANSIFAVTGDGPADDGSGNDLSKPYLVSGEVGAIDWRSVVLTPNGILFQSSRGIYLLQRDLSLNRDIGSDVSDYADEEITSAVSVPDANEVRLSLASGDLLVWNHAVGQWAVWTGPVAVAACLNGGRHALLKADGTVLVEDPTLYADDGVFAPMKVRTPWLSLAGVQGFQRVYRLLVLGEWRSAHQLAVRIRHDFQPADAQTATISPPTSMTPYQFRLHMTRQKCESIQFEVEESQAEPYGAGLALSALAVEVGLKKGAYKLPAAQTTPAGGGMGSSFPTPYQG